MTSKNKILVDIYQSYRRMPTWVQIWVLFILVPVNMTSLLFVSEPMGLWIAILAVGAMLLNVPIMLFDRGFSKMMALPHLLPWTLLVGILLFTRPEAGGAFSTYLWLLLAIDLISLGFDYPDAMKWLKGDRSAA